MVINQINKPKVKISNHYKYTQFFLKKALLSFFTVYKNESK